MPDTRYSVNLYWNCTKCLIFRCAIAIDIAVLSRALVSCAFFTLFSVEYLVCDTSQWTHYVLWDISIFFGNRFSNVHCATHLKLFSSTLDYNAVQLCDLTSVPNFMVALFLSFSFAVSLCVSFTLCVLSCGQTTNHNYIAKCASFSIKCMRNYT